jgi:hypothetical protein
VNKTGFTELHSSMPGEEAGSGSANIHPAIWIVAAAVVALLFKLYVAYTTFGTNDVLSFFQFARALTAHGLEWTYANVPDFNHPPLTAYFIRGIYLLDQYPPLKQDHLFPFLLRAPGIFADFIVVLVLLTLKQKASLPIPTWALVLLALSPAGIMVSGFHGNTDPVLVMFLVLATAMLFFDRPGASGLFLALACQTKIIALLLCPIFLLFWLREKRPASFLAALALASLALCAQPLFGFPMLFLKNVLAYGGIWGLWGFTYWLRLMSLPAFGTTGGHDSLTPTQVWIGVLLKCIIVGSVLVLAWRRRQVDAAGTFKTIGYAWIIFFVFSPAVAPQYLVWFVPFVLPLSPTLFAYLTVATSLDLFFFYNMNANGFPWYESSVRYREHFDWPTWALLPWAAFVAGMIVFWKGSVRQNPGLRLFSLERVRPAAGTGMGN